MESRYPGHHSTSPKEPFPGWMNLSHHEDEHRPGCVAPGSPGHMLLQELLWQFEQRECLVLEEELQHQSCHGNLRCRRHFNAPGLLTLMPASECRQLERLCGRIPPSHVWAVLFRFREILAHNAVLPWELVYVFKQVVRDFISGQQEVHKFPNPSRMLLPVSPPPADSNICGQPTKRSSTALPSHDGQDEERQEIPTISSYVDKHLHYVYSFTGQRASLPFCHSYPSDEPKAYSNTL
ncbi:protein RD3-like [Trichomycterus rosablanca]|uniref:protein RD3-like n=1 Tax=Trichomycterus rosablanca TaxID=2290929 RepID=UPI002F3547D6